MAKQDLTEQEIRSQYIRPAIVAAGWNSAEIREGHHFTVGRMRITSHRRSIRPLLADQTT